MYRSFAECNPELYDDESRRLEPETTMTFEDFLASAKETDETEVDDFLDVAEGEKVVRFDGSMWAIKRADGTYWTLIVQDEFTGTLEQVARPLYDYARDEGALS